MTCIDLRELISAYVDDELRPAQQEVIELHLERCSICQSYMIEQRRVRQLLMSWSAPLWTPDISDAVQRRLRVERRQRSGRVGIGFLAGGVQRFVVPLSLVCAVMIGVLIGRSGLTTSSLGAGVHLTSTTQVPRATLLDIPHLSQHGVQPTHISRPVWPAHTRSSGLQPGNPPQSMRDAVPYIKVVMRPTRVRREVARVIVDMPLPNKLSPGEIVPEVHDCTDIGCVQDMVMVALYHPDAPLVSPSARVGRVGNPRHAGTPQMA